MANIISGIRIVISAALLLCPTLSPTFYVLYIAAGFSDMIDGAVARKTDSVSEFGSRLDTAADIVFVAVCLVKLLPVLQAPVWIYLWVAAIAVIKLSNIATGYIRQKKLTAVHSVMNKVTGGVLFLFPLTLTVIDMRCSAAVVCLLATAAAIQEAYLVRWRVTN